MESQTSERSQPPLYLKGELARGPHSAMNSLWSIFLIVNSALIFKVGKRMTFELNKVRCTLSYW